MKKSIMKRWVKALRSGKYKKGKFGLRRGDTFCCLGVLCDLSKQSTWDKYGFYDNYDTVLPTSVQEWAGMQTDKGEIDARRNLVMLNDGNYKNGNQTQKPWSFKRIADYIEKNWEQL